MKLSIFTGRNFFCTTSRSKISRYFRAESLGKRSAPNAPIAVPLQVQIAEKTPRQEPLPGPVQEASLAEQRQSRRPQSSSTGGQVNHHHPRIAVASSATVTYCLPDHDATAGPVRTVPDGQRNHVLHGSTAPHPGGLLCTARGLSLRPTASCASLTAQVLFETVQYTDITPQKVKLLSCFYMKNLK